MAFDMNPESFQIFGVASVSPKVEIANPEKNVEYILKELDKEYLKGCEFVVFPELCISGYTCGDLFFQDSLIRRSAEALLTLSHSMKEDSRLVAVGVPLLKEDRLYNCAAILCGGKILGIVPKTFIPNYQEFYEKRWFQSGKDIIGDCIKIGDCNVPFGVDLIFSHRNVKVGVEICEDLWVPVPPSSLLCMKGAEIILNLSATDDNIGKYDYIKSLVASQSGRNRCVYAYSSAGNGESSTDLVFSGINIIAADGQVLTESERFGRRDSYAKAWVDVEKLRNDRRKYSTFFEFVEGETHIRRIESGIEDSQSSTSGIEFKVNPHPFLPSDPEKRKGDFNEIIEIQSWGLARRLEATGCKHLVVGISGGLDSTLALLVAHYTFRKLGYDSKGIVGVTMPAEATSERTHSNASKLMEKLGVTSLEIPVGKAVDQHFRDIEHDPKVFDAVYENSQARERTQILMDLANKYNGMVLGTGDMSELALGWCTYNGDHMSMYNVNAGVPKTLVKYLVGWFAENSEDEELKEVLLDVMDTPISPELIPSSSKDEISQKTEELVGPYELHDFFLFHVLRNGFSPTKIYFLATLAFENKYDSSVIKKWLANFYRRFFTQQFKRSCMPDGPKIGSVCLSPRGDWRMPSDASVSIWMKEVEQL